MKISREFQPEIAHYLQRVDEVKLHALIAQEEARTSQQRVSKQELAAAFDKLRSANPFKEIKDPVAWQKEIRKDRELPYR